MPDLGGLYDRNDVKLLILYLLKNISKPLSSTNICDILLRYGLADYFVIAEAIEELIATCLVERIDECLYITGNGEKTIEQLLKNIPLSVREKAMGSALETLSVIKKESQLLTDIKKTEEGYTVKCTIMDEGAEMLSVSLFVGNEFQAQIIQRNFLKNPESIYKGIIAEVTKQSASCKINCRK
jgi:hypothetical protein